METLLGFFAGEGSGCVYRSLDEHGNPGEGELDLYNPDNTDSGALELRFEDEPYDLLPDYPGTAPFCPEFATASGIYALTGAAGADLQVREGGTGTEPPPPDQGGGQQGSGQQNAGNPAPKKPKRKCKKKLKKKGAAAAKKKCGKKKPKK
jgi:hypothetical protein